MGGGTAAPLSRVQGRVGRLEKVSLSQHCGGEAVTPWVLLRGGLCWQREANSGFQGKSSREAGGTGVGERARSSSRKLAGLHRELSLLLSKKHHLVR